MWRTWPTDITSPNIDRSAADGLTAARSQLQKTPLFKSESVNELNRMLVAVIKHH